MNTEPCLEPDPEILQFDDGRTLALPREGTPSCPECGTLTQVHEQGHELIATCPGCALVLVWKKDNPRIVRKLERKNDA